MTTTAITPSLCLHELTATEIVAAIAAGKATCEAVTRACLERIGAREPAVQAWQYLDPAQAIGHRGVNETMPDAPILATQPDPAPYVGVYRRPPVGTNTVRIMNGQLTVDNSPIAFYALDRAVVVSGAQRGNSVEFIRRADGSVGWVRVVGRIARRE